MPARAVGTAGCAEPSRSMHQILCQIAYEPFTCTISRAPFERAPLRWEDRPCRAQRRGYHHSCIHADHSR